MYFFYFIFFCIFVFFLFFFFFFASPSCWPDQRVRYAAFNRESGSPSNPRELIVNWERLLEGEKPWRLRRRARPVCANFAFLWYFYNWSLVGHLHTRVYSTRAYNRISRESNPLVCKNNLVDGRLQMSVETCKRSRPRDIATQPRNSPRWNARRVSFLSVEIINESLVNHRVGIEIRKRNLAASRPLPFL